MIAGAAPHPPFGHLLPVNGEKESGSGLVNDLPHVDVLGAKASLAIMQVEFPQAAEAVVKAQMDNFVP